LGGTKAFDQQIRHRVLQLAPIIQCTDLDGAYQIVWKFQRSFHGPFYWFPSFLSTFETNCFKCSYEIFQVPVAWVLRSRGREKDFYKSQNLSQIVFWESWKTRDVIFTDVASVVGPTNVSLLIQFLKKGSSQKSWQFGFRSTLVLPVQNPLGGGTCVVITVHQNAGSGQTPRGRIVKHW